MATAPCPAGPDDVPWPPIREIFDGGGGVFVGVQISMAEIGWREVTIRDVLNAVSKLYGGYRKLLHSRDETSRWLEGFYKLRDNHLEQLSKKESCEIVSRSQVTPCLSR